MQVLIVDDDDFALSVLENTVTRMGFQTICVADGEQALDILRTGSIRLVITDWDMPKMNGVDLCRAIRREDLSGYVYMIMLTGREGPRQRMEGLCAGADDFLNKPLDPEELLNCLKTAERILSLETSILQGGGNHSDPEVVAACLRVEKQNLAVRGAVQSSDLPNLPVPEPDAAGPWACKILIADDDRLTRDKLRELIAAAGHVVFTAADGIEALRIWQEHTPRVVISDWYMPGKDGVELCRDIRARSESEPVHFIMLTAHSDKHRLLDAYDAGINDFISKPFDFEELLARVRAGIRTAALQDELLRKAAGSQALNARLTTINSRLETLSVTDELTGLFNRRMAMVRLQEHWSTSERVGKPVAVAMIDIDHFKQINDTNGHDAGDAILRQTAAILREQTRGTDVVCRVGGEEFLIIYPSQTVQEAGIAAERFRRKMESAVFTIAGRDLHVTISIGLAMRRSHLPQFTDLLKAADQALYAAKNSGRNRICRDEDPQATSLPSQRDPASTPQTTPQSATVDRPPIDMPTIMKRCSNDTKFASALIERFRSQAASEVAKLEAALASGNADSTARIAHSLKSMAAYVAAEIPAELARKIEDAAHRNCLSEIPPLLVELREKVTAATAWMEQNSRIAA
jgi:diguanylate cyclase (GGDEF)-like protein